MAKNYCEHCGQPVTKTPRETIVHFILDKSGSMQSRKESVISGFNEYIHTLRKDEGVEYKFDLTMFDDSVTRYSRTGINDVKPLNNETYDCNGSTALYDAVCKTIKVAWGEAVRGAKHLVVIMTDGEENASKEFARNDLTRLIKQREEEGNWTFVFLGANQDSWANAQTFGINHKYNVSNFAFTDSGIRSAFMSAAMNTSSLANSAKMSTTDFFNDQDKANMST